MECLWSGEEGRPELGDDMGGLKVEVWWWSDQCLRLANFGITCVPSGSCRTIEHQEKPP